MDAAPTAAAGGGGVGLQRVVIEGEAVGADGGGANEGEAFRAEEDDAPEGAERTNRAALRRRVAGAAAVAETEVGLASRGGRGWQGRARGRSTAARAVLG
jgi:hypothetical protein